MKKRILSLLLTLVMILGMIPATTLTANAASGIISIGSVYLYNGEYLEQGSNIPTTTKPADNYAYFDGTTLELHNFVAPEKAITAESNLVIRLFGYNECSKVEIYGKDLIIRGNGTLVIPDYASGSYGIDVNYLYVESGNLYITGYYRALFFNIQEVTYPAHAIALCSKDTSGTWEPFDLKKVKDNDYKRVMIISGVSFGPQSPAMPEGKTEHDLGTVAASNYPISFQGAWTTNFTSAGYTQYETLTVLNSKSQMVYGKSQKCNGEGFTYDLKDLPADRYVIDEMLTVHDANKNLIFNKSHTFTIDWQPKSDIKYVVAKSTEPIAGTVNTAPTITFDPEYHCKVSDYAEGYWLYYTEGLGWRRMEENTKFEFDKNYCYSFAIETTDGYTFPADGGFVYGALQCDQGYFVGAVKRVEGRDDVAEMVLSYPPCTYGAPLEFIDQTPVFVEGSYANICEVEGFPGETITFSFNHQPLTAAQKAKGYEVRRTFLVYQGLTKPLHTVQKDTGTQPLSFSFTIDQTQTYHVAESIELVKNGTVLQTKSIMYQVKVVSNGTPVIFTADSSNAFGGTVTVDIDAMAENDDELMDACFNDAVKYQWYRGYTQIPGATGQSYSFHADDVGKDIRVTVVYGNNGSISEPFTVTGTAPAFTQQPTGGNVAPGKNMTVKWVTSFTPTKIVVDKYNFVGLASEYTTLSGTATSIELPANEYGYVIKAYYNEKDFITSDKFTVEEVETPTDPEVTRLSGKNRYDTAFSVASQLKENLGVTRFNTVVVAYGRNFPDALTGSYLAATKDAPILLTETGVDLTVLSYIQENLVPGGKVYILGGTAAVSQNFEDVANTMGFDVVRLKDKNRYGTNLAILREAGVNKTDEILIATGSNYADSLSASATGLPMLLVGGSLTDDQIAFLKNTSGKFVIIGGTGAVPQKVEDQLNEIGTATRVKGKTRYETSVVIAQRYFGSPKAAVLAYAQDFPDGLCGGPLAISMGAPLILTSNESPAAADAYIEGVTVGAVTGGTGRLSDETVREIFDLAADAVIPKK